MKRITLLSAIVMFGSCELMGMDASATPGWGGGPGPWGYRALRKAQPKITVSCDQAASDFGLSLQNPQLKMLAAKIAAKSCKDANPEIFGAAMGSLCTTAFSGADDRVAYDAKQAVVSINQTADAKVARATQRDQHRDAQRSSDADAQARRAQRIAMSSDDRAARLASIEENLVQKSRMICEPYLSSVPAEGGYAEGDED